MANSLLTINMITREAVRLFVNTNNFIKSVDRQYDDQFAVDGAKIGDSLRIRLPNDYVVQTGPSISPQATTEQQTTLTLATQKTIPVSFSTKERTMQLDDYSERVLLPMMNNLAGAVAVSGMDEALGGFSNYVANTSGGSIINPTSQTWLQAGAYLNDNEAPMSNRKVVMDPWTEAATVNSLSGLFNPQQQIGEQYRSGSMKNALGFSWMMDQTVIKHTGGTFSAGTINGAQSNVSTLAVNAITGTLKKGDFITVADVNAVNYTTKVTTGKLRQFVVTADVADGATSIPIYPSLVAPVGGVDVQYQTVNAAAANGAAISLVNPASVTFRRNFAFAKEAITMATADLVMPRGVHEASRSVYDGVSMRMVTDYVVGTDQLVTRTDVLYGFKTVRGQWGTVVADAIS